MSSNYGKHKQVATAMNRVPIVLLLIAVALFILADLFFGYDFNWVDYGIVFIIALFGIKGYRKGIIDTVFSLGGYIFGLILAYLFTPKASLLIMQKTELGYKLGNKINEMIPALSNIGSFKASDSESILDIINKTPELSGAIANNPLLEQIMSVTRTATDTGAMYSETVITMNDLIVYSILNILVFFLLLVVIKLIVVLLGRLLTKVLSSSAVLGTANRTGGMVLGFAVGILISYIVFVYAIPALGVINVLKVPENYTESVLLVRFNELILLLF